MTNMRRWSRLVHLSLLCAVLLPFGGNAAEKPNIVIILADDLGYGDVSCFNGRSKIETPNIDRLAADGVRFTDAHAPGAVCVPSRYGLITGRYPFRNRTNPKDGAVIENGRVTLPSLLKQNGYKTAMVGKWHLGFEGGDNFDYSKPLRGGPVDRGFESFFGVHASTDIPPYFYIQNDRAIAAATEKIEASHTPGWTPIQGAFWREGQIAPGMKLEEVMPQFTSKSVAFLEEHKKSGEKKPFFLYVAFTAPHTPWLPTKEFQGRSKASLYGDFVAQVDDSVGKILAALDRAGLHENTLVIFSSDNGPTWYPQDVQRLGHSSTGDWRGMKGDAWEGGHRVPFIVRWPGKVRGGTSSEHTLCFTDLMATFADIIEAKLPNDTGEDSFSFMPALLGKKKAPERKGMTVTSSKGLLAIRDGEWKLITGSGSGGFTKTSPREDADAQGQLYNLAKDPAEQTNLWTQEPEMVKRLSTALDKSKKAGRTRPTTTN